MDQRPINFTRFNIIYGSLVALGGFAFLVYAVANVPNIAPEAVGSIMGYTTSMVFGSGVAAVVVWLISGRSPRSASITFNCVLTFFLLSTFVGFISNIDINSTAQKRTINTATEELRADYSNFVEDPDAGQQELEQLHARSKNLMDEIGKQGDVNTKKATAVAKAYFDRGVQLESKFSAAVEIFETIDFLDPVQLSDDATSENRKVILNDFIAVNRNLVEHYSNMDGLVRNEMKRAGVDRDYTNEFMKGVHKSVDMRVKLAHEAYSLHLRRGEGILSIVTLLDEHRDIWEYDQQADILIFDDEWVHDTYRQKMDDLIAFEDVFFERVPEIVQEISDTYAPTTKTEP